MKDFIKNTLQNLQDRDKLRKLSSHTRSKDFASNDYLGFNQDPELKTAFLQRLHSSPFSLGSTGSRLISGNSKFTETLEQKIASFHQNEAGLIFNSGFDANLAVFSCFASRHDTIIIDELAHASIVDGTKLSHAKIYKFRHNDLDDLRKKIAKGQGKIFIGIESVYSMDGDFAPLEEIVKIAKQHGAYIILDEAHSGGIYGHQGRGLANQLGVQNDIFIRLITFGKALGAQGSIVLGNKETIDYLINSARSFIYTTGHSPIIDIAIDTIYDHLANSHPQKQLFRNIDLFKKNIPTNLKNDFISSSSQIQSLIIGDNSRTKHIAKLLKEEDFFVCPILSPTVKEGTERIRFCLHQHNTEEEISSLLQRLSLLMA